MHGAALSEAGCSRNHEQCGYTNSGSDTSHHTLTGRCEAFDCDGCRHGGHRAKIHDTDRQQNQREIRARLPAVDSIPQPLPPRSAWCNRKGPPDLSPSRQQARLRAFHVVSCSAPAISMTTLPVIGPLAPELVGAFPALRTRRPEKRLPLPTRSTRRSIPRTPARLDD